MSQYRKGSKLPMDGLILFMLAMVTISIIIIVMSTGIPNIAENAVQTAFD